MTSSLSPETGTFLNEDTSNYTRSKIAAMRQPCPRCGTSVSFGAVDARSQATVGDRHFRIGRPQYSCDCFNG
uniref:hypothetical protein n=1 Tax=Paractinoplanes polyasparticus TaxID=2856853 RepID=UPI001C86178B|nr:hypothetical protein [Actinoplanes polyasparticus]